MGSRCFECGSVIPLVEVIKGINQFCFTHRRKALNPSMTKVLNVNDTVGKFPRLGMKGIINSGLNPVEDTLKIGNRNEKLQLADRLLDHDYLIALLQKACFDGIQYDVDDDRFKDITPAHFKQVVNTALQQLESEVWTALRRFECTVKDSGVDPYPGDKKLAQEMDKLLDF